MATVLNRSTLQLIPSANTPDYPPEQWLINPVLPSCPQRYWKVVGDEVVEMTPEEKAVVDAPAPVVRPEDVVAAYQQFAAAWRATGLAVTATYEDAVSAMTTWFNEAEDVPAIKQRTAVKDAVLLWRFALELRGGSWADFLAWAAEQPQA